MALVNCPECGKENVSDTAESCPACGYAIRSHFLKIKLEEMRIESEKQAEIRRKELEAEEKRRQEERIKNVPKLEKPQLVAPIIVTVISVLVMILGFGLSNTESSSSYGSGDPQFQGGYLVFFGIAILCYAIYLFSKRMSAYNLSKDNFEEYQRQVIREQDELQKRLEAERAAKMKQQANIPKCPVCGSANVSKISTLNRSASIATVGLASSKIGKQYECKACKHKW